MTAYRYVTADVFTDRMFLGNPVAVLLGAAGLSTAQMQAVAREFNYTETTFVLPPQNPAHTAQLRIFTPSREVPFAGHPTIGTAFVLAREAAARGEMLDRIVFEEAAGLVAVTLLRDDTTVSGAELASPEPLTRRTQVPAERAAACLSLAPNDLYSTVHAPQVISVGLPFLVVEVATREALRRARPDRAAFDAVLPLDGATAVYVYTRDGCPDEAGCDLQARMFTPRMTEDPATGSATAATAALLAELAGGGDLTLRVGQGVDMGRPSVLLARVSRKNRTEAIALTTYQLLERPKVVGWAEGFGAGWRCAAGRA
jgi:trans-2,3-dihydro-3-hydroxyanthranilate isomerase